MENSLRSGRAVKMLLSNFLFNFYYGGLLKTTTMFYPKWMVLYGVSDNEISIVYTALLAGGQFGGMMTSSITSVLPPRATFIAASIAAAAFLGLASIAPNIYVLAVCYGCAIFCITIPWMSAIGYTSATFTAEVRSQAQSFGVVGTSVGSVLMAPLIQLLFEHYSVSQAMLIQSAVYAHLLIGAVLLPIPEVTKKTTNVKLTDILDKCTLAYSIGLCLVMIGKQAQLPYMIPLANQVGVEGYEAASVLMLTSLLDVPSRLVGGQVSGIACIRRQGQSLYVGGFVILLGCMNLLSLIVVNDYASYAAWATVFGLCWGMPVSSQYSAISEFTAPENTTKVLSFNAAIQLFGLIIIPMLNGAIVQRFDSYRPPFIVAGSLMLTGGFLCILARVTYRVSNSKNKSGNNNERESELLAMK